MEEDILKFHLLLFDSKEFEHRLLVQGVWAQIHGGLKSFHQLIVWTMILSFETVVDIALLAS